MANKKVFQSSRGKTVKEVDALNNAGGTAYQLSAEHALAQYAVTGFFGGTYYTSAEAQLKGALELANKVTPEFLAQTALYARREGYMKDMPAFLLAVLATKDVDLLSKVFNRVIDNGRMLRTFCQIVRSGVTGRKSFGTRPKKLIQNWLNNRSVEALFRDSVGNDPSIADVIKMVHPRARNAEYNAFYAYLIGKEYKKTNLPKIVKDFEKFKAGKLEEPPKGLEFRMLTALPLTKEHWVKIAKDAPWHMARMNLNTFKRHGVFEEKGMDKLLAEKLSDPEAIARSKVFPFQLFQAYQNTQDVPAKIQTALQDALELSLKNIPEIEGQVYVFPDVSGSMSSQVTGGYNSKTRAIDAAALIASAFMAKNPDTVVIPFEGNVVRLRLNPRDSVMTNAQKLAAVGGGSTNCSAPLAYINREGAKGSLVLYVSDNESWVDSSYGSYRGTASMVEWQKFKARNPKAKLVCIDLTPGTTSQVINGDKDILNVGGFSDNVFNVIAQFVKGELNGEFFANIIKQEEI